MRMSLLQINVTENRRDNQEWTLQRNRQHWVHKTKYEDEQNNPQKAKKMSNTDPPKPEVILTNFFAEPTVLLVPITSRDKSTMD
jgi:GH43 family beta-xylosidase